MKHVLINADVLVGLRSLASESVDCVVTSPPYWGLRDYGVPGQIGLEAHPRDFIKKMVQVFREVKRVLKPTGTVWLNLGDTYYNAPCGSVKDKDWQRPSRTACETGQASKAFKPEGNWLQPKQLLGLPWRVASALQEDGWVLRNAVIWHKPNHMPSSVKDRFCNAYEFVFSFVKSNTPRHFVYLPTGECVSKRPSRNEEGVDWAWADCEKCGGKGKVTVRDLEFFVEGEGKTRECPECKGTGRFRKSFWSSHDYWFDLDAVREQHKTEGYKSFNRRVRDVKAGRVASGQYKASERELEQYAEATTTQNPAGKNPGDVWRITTRGFPGAHFAVFPKELPERCIKAGCPAEVCVKCGKPRTRIMDYKANYEKREPTHTANGSKTKVDSSGWKQPRREMLGWSDCGCSKGFRPSVVLDPFAGSGTVGVVASDLGRSSVQIELKPEYCEMIKKRMRFDVPRLGDMEFEFKRIKGEPKK